MVAPALGSLVKELKIVNEFEIALNLSTFVLAYAIGPLFLGPMSEIYGCVPVLQLANIFYLVFNIACGVCTSKGQMLAFRFLSGLGGSAPLAVNNAPARYRSPH
jgi:MFS family permease